MPSCFPRTQAMHIMVQLYSIDNNAQSEDERLLLAETRADLMKRLAGLDQ